VAHEKNLKSELVEMKNSTKDEIFPQLPGDEECITV
jgi:hypothetical protein